MKIGCKISISLILLVILVDGCSKPIPKEANEQNIIFDKCFNKYSNYFKDDPDKTFQIVFSSSYSKEQIEKFLRDEVKTNFEYRMEFKGRYKYFINPIIDNGLEVLCTIEQSPYYLGTSLIGGGGGTFTNE